MKKLTKETKVLFICLGISILLISLAIVSGVRGVIGQALVISIFIIVLPQFFMRHKRYMEIKEMEEKFPSFLRDLIESLMAGLSFPKAFMSVAQIYYGPLSVEIKKMANQLSWGIPLDKVLEHFSERIKSSKRMYLATKIIRESYLSGGDVVSTLDSLVEGQITLVEVKKERSSMLNQYVILMYVITFIFLVIIILINKLMIPMFGISPEFGGLTNPCAETENLLCAISQTVASGFFKIEKTHIAAYYVSLFFFISVIQSFFAGLVAGQISEGSLIAGLKHSLILVGVVVGVFFILVEIGLLGV